MPLVWKCWVIPVIQRSVTPGAIVRRKVRKHVHRAAGYYVHKAAAVKVICGFVAVAGAAGAVVVHRYWPVEGSGGTAYVPPYGSMGYPYPDIYYVPGQVAESAYAPSGAGPVAVPEGSGAIYLALAIALLIVAKRGT